MVVGCSHDVTHSPLLWLLVMVASLHLMYSSVEVVDDGVVVVGVVVVDGSLLLVARFVVVWGTQPLLVSGCILIPWLLKRIWKCMTT